MIPTDLSYKIDLENNTILGKKHYTFSYFTDSENNKIYITNSNNKVVHFDNYYDGLKILNDILLVYTNCINIEEIKEKLYNIKYE